MMFHLVSFVGRGSVRRKVLKALLKPNSPTELARQMDIERSTVSRAILQLVEKGLMECLTPDERMGRYYRTTEIGRKVLDVIEGNGE